MAVCIPGYTECHTTDERKAASIDKDNWWVAEKYALGIAMGYTAILIIVIIVQYVKYLSFSKRMMRGTSLGFFNRIAAFCRAMHYNRLRLGGFYFPYTFPMLLLSFFFIWTTVWSFAVFPYYRAGIEWGSPPLGVRSGWMALGLIVPVFAMGSRVNPISFLTGISHERLQVYHQYGAQIILFLSVVHTIPFIIEPYQQGYQLGGTKLARFFLKKYYDGTEQFWNGIPPLVALIWIVISSMGYFRKLNYEFFVIQHVVSTIFFLVWMFIHVDVMYPATWHHMFMATGVLIWSWVGRILITFWANEFKWHDAQLHSHADDIVRLRIITPLRWKPAQNIYLRFPTINIIESHPFTISSIPSLDVHSNSNIMQLLLRGKKGITGKLNSKAQSGKQTIPVLIDGPYGGLPTPLDGYSRVLLLSGGTGVNANISILLDLMRKMERSETLIEYIDFIWTIRSTESLDWFSQTFKQLSSYTSFDNLNITIHITGNADVEKELVHDDKFYSFVKGRPDVKSIIRNTSAAAQGGDLAVSVCGPGDFMFDTMNECSSIELKIATGDENLPRRLFAHSESYDW
ncbi:hypothetical protein WALSEDRAFT_59419 [Wallemia mellicola CBS 633.66]|uniref:FAD-binding FR-type domain-containing protein n=2 Tax=Wallemia mellicola TaxID=1708541 RepID=I4YIK4_WALMC|nr:hypothetical protein WALSEDRAFT_59419 [Wallemia mellicola CBS 633.66]TIB87571.1 hypothetical protein E3Q19_03553 [Wallemia mellicola]EIM23796.1 hypothetical protein WALSEDRAFT_59419 [Wallemia mellicola CBS 633.66]TIC24948.1 hypothetical protein E3Q11_03494 [Wallemia mellicola]TIC27607.1 hypothetical protein E3Q10_03646 [Wallemia mellicola]TIC72944.1 hypothetical protein E3Q00_03442 [Wallemia mellicola]|eukprot:XP_006956459.1 hypothetical protein WALSEDRAFT_59419 [Wallemia mellicola CBS 633.66]